MLRLPIISDPSIVDKLVSMSDMFSFSNARQSYSYNYEIIIRNKTQDNTLNCCRRAEVNLIKGFVLTHSRSNNIWTLCLLLYSGKCIQYTIQHMLYNMHCIYIMKRYIYNEDMHCIICVLTVGVDCSKTLTVDIVNYKEVKNIISVISNVNISVYLC